MNMLTGTPHAQIMARPDSVKIVANIPFPTIRCSVGGKWDGVFEKMKVGDAVFFDNRRSSNAFTNAARQWVKKDVARTKMVFRSAKTERGYGVWRAS